MERPGSNPDLVGVSATVQGRVLSREAAPAGRMLARDESPGTLCSGHHKFQYSLGSRT